MNARLILGATPAARAQAVDVEIARLRAEWPDRAMWIERDPARWIALTDLASEIPPRGTPVAIVVHEIDRAFPACQTGGTRFVLTSPLYWMQKLVDRVEASGSPGVFIVAGDEEALRRQAAEVFHRRGVWRHFEIVSLVKDAEEQFTAKDAKDAKGNRIDSLRPSRPLRLIVQAFHEASPLKRLELCREACRLVPDSAAAWLAAGSACMEQQLLDEAGAALDRAAALAPEWEAVDFERGKLWLRIDDLPRASEAFARAGERMPTLAAAFSNLGATLGELDRREEAVAAFEQALAHDPFSSTALNNVGVVSRELGRLDQSEAALRRVIEITPDFVFGHYNLGHTLFLQGRFAEARDAYEEGQRRDPEKNVRQACRLALCRLASGDPDGARRDLLACLAGLSADMKRDILTHAQEILEALVGHRPRLRGGSEFARLISDEMNRAGHS